MMFFTNMWTETIYNDSNTKLPQFTARPIYQIERKATGKLCSEMEKWLLRKNKRQILHCICNGNRAAENVRFKIIN